MGVWSKIGKGLLYGGSLAAIPFTGGASGSLLGALGVGSNVVKGIGLALPAIGAIAGGASAGRAAGREREAGINQNQDLLRQRAAQMLEEALQGRAGLDLKQRQFGLDAPGQRAGNAVRGDVLANAQDASIGGPITHTRGQVPQISGGLRPSLISGNTRQLGSEMSRGALMSQMAGDKFEPLPPPSFPEVTPQPQAGKFDTFLNILGGVGQFTGALDQAGMFKPQVPQIPPPQWQIPQIPGGRRRLPQPWEEANF